MGYIVGSTGLRFHNIRGEIEIRSSGKPIAKQEIMNCSTEKFKALLKKGKIIKKTEQKMTIKHKEAKKKK